MPTYRYKVKLPDGNTHAGEMEAVNSDHLEQKLIGNGVEVLYIREKSASINITLPGLGRVTSRELVIFTRQLSTMIDAGLPIVQALDLLGTQEPNPLFKRIILQVKNDVASGITFADALRKHPSVFDTLYCSLVGAGEVGGILDTILARLCIQIEKSQALKRKIVRALSYPIGTLIIALLITIFMLWKVIPSFEEMFKSMGNQLPALTQYIVDASAWFGDNIVVIFAILIGLPLGLYYALRFPKVRRAFDSFALRLPAIGEVIRKTAVSRFTRTMSTMLSSGVPLMEGLSIVSEASGNLRVRDGIVFARKRIGEGATLADPLMYTGIFPDMVVQMIRVGEETGALDIMLGKIADFYDDEVDDALAKLMSLIEPLMMLLIGGLVGGMLIGMYLPIFSMSPGG